MGELKVTAWVKHEIDPIFDEVKVARTERKPGDYRLTWDSRNDVETGEARETFGRLRQRGYSAFSVKDRGERGTLIAEFDPNAERLILVPPMQGG